MLEVLEILKYILPSVVVLITAYLMINSFLGDERKKAEQAMHAANRKDMLPLRLQAYERLTVFLERSHPVNLVSRVTEPGMSARDLQHYLIETLKTEFEHNLSQQLYVSAETWSSVRFVKDDAIKMINLLSGSLPPNSTANELAKNILEYYMQAPHGIPAQKSLDIINAEVKRLF